MNARAVVRACLDLPQLLDRIGDTDDLVTHGVNSGEIVRIALKCEEHLGRMLTDDELAELSTVHAIGLLIGGEHFVAQPDTAA
ncbi:Phosphopantetheine attachment site [Amycolatopsis xylanica]|uniref:Phosphopantetheine attachment site n=1 Tax=Amycolatopsis xylanica TaxID=589385 RepID=A0A1H2WBA9_9PSEU|nr:Phosphopantetheine attachment site [Amycolatopsis xylanica]